MAKYLKIKGIKGQDSIVSGLVLIVQYWDANGVFAYKQVSSLDEGVAFINKLNGTNYTVDDLERTRSREYDNDYYFFDEDDSESIIIEFDKSLYNQGVKSGLNYVVDGSLIHESDVRRYYDEQSKYDKYFVKTYPTFEEFMHDDMIDGTVEIR